jgi:putative ABC transport system permease protein
MDRLRGWWKRLAGLFFRRRKEAELREEVAFHLEMETAHRATTGAAPWDARRAATVAFGDRERFKEEVRSVWGWAWLNDLRRDLVLAVRGARRSPGYSVIVVLTLALGIGANTAIFSALYGVLLKPLPYQEPDRLVRIFESSGALGNPQGSVSPGTFVDLRARGRSFESVALFYFRPDWLLNFGDESQETPGAHVSPALFDVLGVQPAIGRSFSTVPEGEVLIGHGLWQRQFGGSHNALGQQIQSEGRSTLRVVGIMPPGFDYPNGAEIWSAEVHGPTVSRVERQFRFHGAVGRLSPGVTLADAQVEAAAIAAQLETEHPAAHAGWSLRLVRLDASMVGHLRPMFLLMLGVVAGVLLIACANVANLIMARAASRRNEVAVRIALGASRQHLTRQWLTEGALMAGLGGLMGLVLALVGEAALVRLAPADLPRMREVGLNLPVLGFALALTVLTALFAGLAPAWHTRRAHQGTSLRLSGDGDALARARSRRWLVAGEVALTLVLLTATSLLLRSFVNLRATDLGFRPAGVVTTNLRYPMGRFADRRPWAALADHSEQLLTELRGLSGGSGVAAISALPLAGDRHESALWRRDAPGAEGRRPPTSAEDQWQAEMRVVTTDYFRIMGIPVHRGRSFAASDRFTAQELTDPAVARPRGVALINQTMARRYWPDQDPLGQVVFIFDDQTFAAEREIVGIVGDVQSRGPMLAAPPAVFLPFGQHPELEMALVLQTAGPPAGVIIQANARIRQFDAQLAIGSWRPVEAVVAESLNQPRFTLALVGGFASLALLLAMIGIHGVVNYLVIGRTREIGIRVALGATERQVVGLVLQDGWRPLLGGLVAGSVGGLAVGRGMASLLFGVPPLDPASLLLALAGLSLAAVAAAIPPTRRAARIPPTDALRVG